MSCGTAWVSEPMPATPSVTSSMSETIETTMRGAMRRPAAACLMRNIVCAPTAANSARPEANPVSTMLMDSI